MFFIFLQKFMNQSLIELIFLITSIILSELFLYYNLNKNILCKKY